MLYNSSYSVQIHWVEHCLRHTYVMDGVDMSQEMCGMGRYMARQNDWTEMKAGWVRTCVLLNLVRLFEYVNFDQVEYLLPNLTLRAQAGVFS